MKRAILGLIALFPVTVIIIAIVVLATVALPPSALGQEACFKTVDAPPWIAQDVGPVKGGASRPVPGAVGAVNAFELCSISTGIGKTEDTFRFLFQKTRADFEVTVLLNDFSGGGASGFGGLLAYENWRIVGSPFVGIGVLLSPAAGPLLVSNYRPVDGAETQPLGNAVGVSLPVWLRIRREGTAFLTSFSKDGKDFKVHSKVDGADTPLADLFMFAGMAQASINPRAPGSAFFGEPSIVSQERDIAPRIDTISPATSPLEGGVKVKITGALLGATTDVSLAGVPATVLEAGDGSVTVLAGESTAPSVGDVVVTTKTGSTTILNGFVYLGHLFIRGSFLGKSGPLDLSDAVASLNFIFLGGRPPICVDAADANGDHKLDIADPIFVLNFLFLGGPAPPAPFPQAGLGSLPCGDPPAARLLKLSNDTLQEGDLVKISGENLPTDPADIQVFFGDSAGHVLQSDRGSVLVEVPPVDGTGKGGGGAQFTAQVSAIINYHLPPLVADCRLRNCPTTIIGVVALDPGLVATLLTSRTSKLPLGVGKPLASNPDAIVLDIDRGSWDPKVPFPVSARLNLPVVNGLSRGPIASNFEYFQSEVNFPDWVQGLADRLQGEFSSGLLPQEVLVRADLQNSRILFQPRKELSAFLASAWIDSVIHIGWGPPNGTCGPTHINPLTDRRAFGWCRFAELIEECGGFPKWEYFIPVSKVYLSSGSIFPLPFPDHESTSTKGVLYNIDAYCHVRSQKLYKQCTLTDLAAGGHTSIPDFPRSAIVIKTAWSRASDLMASGKDPSKHYSFVYSGDGHRYCLTAFHFTTKDINQWFWCDFYIEPPDGFGGCEGDNSDRPASITGVWANYKMCTNIAEMETICGNAVFPECGVQTCIGCHKSEANFGSVKTDFLPSVAGDGIPGPCP